MIYPCSPPPAMESGMGRSYHGCLGIGVLDSVHVTQYFDQKYQGLRVDKSNPVGNPRKDDARQSPRQERKPQAQYRYIVSAFHT